MATVGKKFYLAIGSIQQFLVDRLDRSALTEGRISTLLTIQVALSSTIRVLTVLKFTPLREVCVFARP